MQTTAQIITVGDELLLGQVVDTNSAWIGEQAADSGFSVCEILSVADKREAITEALSRGLAKYDVVIMTGGLGPTKDDITKHTIAEFFGVDLVRNDDLYKQVERYMAERGVAFNALNQAQADVPRGFTALPNPVGTAPGLYGQHNGKLLFCLPGVPFEMKGLFVNEVLPIVKAKFVLKSVIRRTVLVYGIAESELAVTISDWEDALPPYMSLAYLPNPKGIRLRLSVCDTPSGVDAVSEIEAKFKTLKTIIPQYYLGYEPTSIENEIACRLAELGHTLGIAESCTGGNIAARCTALSGASRWFRGSVTAYSNEVKSAILGVDAALISTYGAVSGAVVEAMASGARQVLGSTYAIATSGIAGPEGGSAEKPVGTVWIGVATPGGVHSFMKNFGQPRGVCVERASSAALSALLTVLK